MPLRSLLKLHQVHWRGLGVKISSVKLDLDAMMESKDNIVSGLTSGIAHLFKKNKITRLTGSATITAPGTVELTDGPDKGGVQC